MYNGVINVYKEPGFTSFDVVAKLRGILGQKKIGHTGTLDPDAEGVLVVCAGNATKLCDILTDKDKSYDATLLLGVTTDTEDTSGTILCEKEVAVTKEQVEVAVMSFVGEYQQIPPMYSAIKIQGKKLYELAREGITIEREARPVVIHSIEITSIELPRVNFKVNCGKGTYIRSLCRDIGEKLECGGTMEHLSRDCVHASETGISFTKENAYTLSQLQELKDQDGLADAIMPVDALFPNLLQFTVNESGEKKLLNGNILSPSDFKNYHELKNGEQCLVYNGNNCFLAIYQYDEANKGLKSYKMFL